VPNDDRDVLEDLKFELEFLEKRQVRMLTTDAPDFNGRRGA